MQRQFFPERLGWQGSWEQLFRIIYTGLVSAASKTSLGNGHFLLAAGVRYSAISVF